MEAKERGVTSHLKLRLNPNRACTLPSRRHPAQRHPPPQGFLCFLHGNPRYPAAPQITRFEDENLVVITMSKELLGHTATQTKTDLPSRASWQYNLPSETAYSVSLLMNICWCFVLAGCSHGSAKVFHFRDRICLVLFAFYSKYILPVTFMDKLQFP